MAALIWAVAAAAAVSTGTAARADSLTRWEGFILDAAARAHIPADWVRRVMRAESAGRTMLAGRPITSTAGAMGLMQLMPATWGDMRARLRLGDDPYDPHDNILAGAFFLRAMYDRFGYPGLFGAYNAGPARYRAHLSGAALPGETTAYLAKLTVGDAASAQDANPATPGLFAAVHGQPDVAQTQQNGCDCLFAVRHDMPVAARQSGSTGRRE